MGGASALKHLFLILFLALSFAGLAYSACSPDVGDPCPNGPTQCCSNLCQAAPAAPGTQVVKTCVACLDPGQPGCTDNADCCGGKVCKSGSCNSCTCIGKISCSPDVPCGSDIDCCSGLCSGSRCVPCIPAGASCGANPTACCNGLSCTGGFCGGVAANGIIGSWFDSSLYGWIGLAVLTAASFLGLAYMASKAFELQVLDAWVRVELGELMKSVVIAVFCIALIATVNMASQFLAGEGGSSNVITNAQTSMKMLYDDSHSLYMVLAKAYFNVAKVAGYSYTAGTSMLVFVTISYSASPGAGLSPLLGEVGQALDAVASYMMLATAQAAFLQFFATASVVMLPVGIFLRSFSFTRKLGGTLLAATIAASVVYPSSIQLSSEVYKTFQPDLKASTEKLAGPDGVPDAGNPPLTSVVCSQVMKEFVQSPIPLIGGENGWHIVVCLPLCSILAAIPGAGAEAFTSCYQGLCKLVIKIIFAIVKAVFPIIMYASVFATMDQGTQPGALLQNYYTPLQDYGLPAVAKFTVISLFTFLIPIIITLALLRALAASFGGEAQLYGLSKLV